MSRLYDVWPLKNLLAFNELDQRGFVSKGFRLETPNLTYIDDHYRNEWKDRCRNLIRSISQGDRLQINWTVTADFRKELQAYDQVTETKATNNWVKAYRGHKAYNYIQRMENRHLRRESPTVFLTKRIKTGKPAGLSAHELNEHYSNMLTEYDNEFEHFGQRLKAILGPMGTRIEVMTDADHIRAVAHFFNPSYRDRTNFDPLKLHRRDRSLVETYWASANQGSKAPFGKAVPYGFYHDGYYYNVLTLKQQPDDTDPSILDRLTTVNPELDYSITLNVFPKDRKGTISKLEKLSKRLEGDFQSEQKPSIRVEILRLHQVIEELANGTRLPVDIQFIITIWAKSLPELTGKTLRLQTAINEMSGAQYTEPLLATTCKNLWFQTFPGNSFGGYKHHIIEDATDEWVADLLPLSSTFVGNLDGAEALFDGSNGQVIGLKTFVNGTPQPGVLFGMPGAGKSLLMIDLFTQTDPYFGYTAIIEEGNSFGLFTQLKGEEPTIITPDGDLCINPFDTLGLPLSSSQLNSTVGLFGRMAGVPEDPERAAIMLALISKNVGELYTAQYEDWMQQNKALEPEIARHAIAANFVRSQLMPSGSTFLEAWVEYRDRAAANNDQVLAHREKITDSDISKFLKNPDTELFVRNVAYSFFKPEDYPRLSMLVEFFEHSKDSKAKDLAPRIADWAAFGPNGGLFDGATNANLKRNHDHFELGRIDNSAEQFKGVVSFLIFNYIRNKIVTLPRAVRKRMLFEEFARIMDLPGDQGKKTAEESWAQLRKFNGWPFAVVQNQAQFKKSPCRDVLLSTSKMFIFLKQRNRQDLDELPTPQLPEVAKTLIQNFPLPENLPDGARFSSFLLYQEDAQRPIIGTGRNYASPEMLYVASTTGEVYETRAKRLKKYSNILEGVIQEANKISTPKETDNNQTLNQTK